MWCRHMWLLHANILQCAYAIWSLNKRIVWRSENTIKLFSIALSRTTREDDAEVRCLYYNDMNTPHFCDN